jgi:catechol 2,3-dioxygenase-like lactoylglutathione lyase family enzyme
MTQSIRVTGLDHIVLVVADVERSLQWYTERLGLAGVRVDEWRLGQAFFPSVRVDPTTLIDLFPARAGAPEATPANLDHFCLVIEPTDLDGVAASAAFDVVSGPTDGLFGARGYARSLYVRDPDGNVVELRSYT